jgi:hypothetical protein
MTLQNSIFGSDIQTCKYLIPINTGKVMVRELAANESQTEQLELDVVSVRIP